MTADDRARINDGPLADEMQPFFADAWDEGYEAGHEDARAVQATYPDATPNPYRMDPVDFGWMSLAPAAQDAITAAANCPCRAHPCECGEARE